MSRESKNEPENELLKKVFRGWGDVPQKTIPDRYAISRESTITDARLSKAWDQQTSGIIAPKSTTHWPAANHDGVRKVLWCTVMQGVVGLGQYCDLKPDALWHTKPKLTDESVSVVVKRQEVVYEASSSILQWLETTELRHRRTFSWSIRMTSNDIANVSSMGDATCWRTLHNCHSAPKHAARHDVSVWPRIDRSASTLFLRSHTDDEGGTSINVDKGQRPTLNFCADALVM